jgi:hypothetical protein
MEAAGVPRARVLEVTPPPLIRRPCPDWSLLLIRRPCPDRSPHSTPLSRPVPSFDAPVPTGLLIRRPCPDRSPHSTPLSRPVSSPHSTPPVWRLPSTCPPLRLTLPHHRLAPLAPRPSPCSRPPAPPTAAPTPPPLPPGAQRRVLSRRRRSDVPQRPAPRGGVGRGEGPLYDSEHTLLQSHTNTPGFKLILQKHTRTRPVLQKHTRTRPVLLYRVRNERTRPRPGRRAPPRARGASPTR